MSHIQSHHGGADEAHKTFLVLLKVYGDTIQLWSREKMSTIGKTHFFRISCHNVETNLDLPGSNIQVFTLSEPAQMHEEVCSFADQFALGQPIGARQLAIFMTGPVSSLRKASYAIDLALSSDGNTDDDSEVQEQQISDSNELVDKIGSAYLYLDPNFSSQGIQRTPIIARQTHLPIGQMQIEYLIVTNPIGYGQPAIRPDWLLGKRCFEAGHRGSGSGRRVDLPEDLLENTIASFNYAHRHGADMCELDVVVSADGVPVVYHDFDVDAVAAQQSCDQLGKFRVQVNQFTVKQLRDFQFLALHDGEGHAYTLNVPNQAESNRPFPTLAEVLDQVDESCGLNVEIKWPQMLESGKMEAKRFCEINYFVDRIIDVCDRHAANRHIVLESFDADLTLMLRLKQNRFPVVFLNQGMTDRYERYVDTRARSIFNGVYFAQAFGLAGIDIISDYYLSMGKQLVDFIKSHDLIPRGWGDMGENSEILDLLRGYGLQCITYDRIDQMKRPKQSVDDTNCD